MHIFPASGDFQVCSEFFLHGSSTANWLVHGSALRKLLTPAEEEHFGCPNVIYFSFNIFHLEFFLLFLCPGILLTEQLAVNDAILVTSLQEPLASGTDKAGLVIHILTCS